MRVPLWWRGPGAWREHPGVEFTVDAVLGGSECQGEAPSSADPLCLLLPASSPAGWGFRIGTTRVKCEPGLKRWFRGQAHQLTLPEELG